MGKKTKKSSGLSGSPDLQHSDWLLRSITEMVRNVSLHIRIKQENKGPKKLLILSNISESDLSKLTFLTNSDKNNNYLYMENMEVFFDDDYQKTPIQIPGINIIAINAWNNADSKAFLNGQTTFKPFLNPIDGPSIPGIVQSTVNPISIPLYVDIMTSMCRYLPNTTGVVKKFSITLNPDRDEPPGYHYTPAPYNSDSDSGDDY